MKKLQRLSFLSTFLIFSIINPLSAQLDFDFDVRIFYTPDGKSFCEYYFMVDANTLNPIENEAGLLQAGVYVSCVSTSNTDTTQTETIIMAPPRTADQKGSVFLGSLRLANPVSTNFKTVVIVSDYYGQNADTLDINIEKIGLLGQQPTVSNIVLSDTLIKTDKLNDFTKSGYNVIPKLNNYYAAYNHTLSFYAEVYNTLNCKEDKLLATISIVEQATQQVYGSLRKVLKITPDSVIPLLGSFNIDVLPSGEYALKIEIKDKTNQGIASNSITISRNNPNVSIPLNKLDRLAIKTSFIGNTSYDDVKAYTRSLRPIASDEERMFIDQLRKNDVDTMRLQSFFLAFCLKRNYNNPDVFWQDYNANVKTVEDNFSTNIKHGYETDRGRVFLEYGAPNHRTEIPSEPSSYPYEIWQYYKAKNRNNIRFIFYNRDLVSNDYELLHSDMKGEARNDNWERVLRSRNNNDPNYNNAAPEQFGERSQDYFNNPR